jgi:hypothetical protein
VHFHLKLVAFVAGIAQITAVDGEDARIEDLHTSPEVNDVLPRILVGADAGLAEFIIDEESLELVDDLVRVFLVLEHEADGVIRLAGSRHGLVDVVGEVLCLFEVELLNVPANQGERHLNPPRKTRPSEPPASGERCPIRPGRTCAPAY